MTVVHSTWFWRPVLLNCHLQKHVTTQLCERIPHVSRGSSSAVQVTSSRVSRTDPPLEASVVAAAEPPKGELQALRRGQVEDWAALERIMYDILYVKVPVLLLCQYRR